MKSDLLTTAQAGKALGIGPRRVLDLIRDGRLAAVLHGRDYLIRSSDLAAVRHRKPGRPKR